MTPLRRGARRRIGEVHFEVLGPSAAPGRRGARNDQSLVLRARFGRRSFLLTGDMFIEAEGVLVRGDTSIDSDVLKVGHHGSRSSSSAAFLERVRPSVAVVSAEKDSRFGHAQAEKLDALGRNVPEVRVYGTSEQGTVEFVTDGRRLEVKTER